MKSIKKVELISIVISLVLLLTLLFVYSANWLIDDNNSQYSSENYNSSIDNTSINNSNIETSDKTINSSVSSYSSHVVSTSASLSSSTTTTKTIINDKSVLSINGIQEFENDGYYSKSFSTYIEQGNSINNEPQIITCTAKYNSNNNEFPYIKLSLVDINDNEIYFSPNYTLGKKEFYETKQWSVPPFQSKYNRIKIDITIPDGVILYIQDISNLIRKMNTDDEKIKYHSHLGFMGLCAQSTAYSFEMAGKMGYKSCIAVPQFTSDGVCVCMHDNFINNLLRNKDGSPILINRPISSITYKELMNYDAGILKDQIYASTKVPTLDEFFAICVKYNMMPVLSIHTQNEFRNELGIHNFEHIRSLAQKHGLLGKLGIKCGTSIVFKNAISVFKNDIAQYIIIQPSSTWWDPLVFSKECGFIEYDAKNIKESKYNVIMEFFYTSDSDFVLSNAIGKSLNEGFKVSIAATKPVGISGPEIKRFIDMGVTEFTVNRHCSIGLNW